MIVKVEITKLSFNITEEVNYNSLSRKIRKKLDKYGRHNIEDKPFIYVNTIVYPDFLDWSGSGRFTRKKFNQSLEVFKRDQDLYNLIEFDNHTHFISRNILSGISPSHPKLFT